MLKEEIKKEIRNMIKNELSQMGYNPIYLGTNYLLEAIHLCYKLNISSNNLNLDKDIYKKISESYCKNIKTIKSDIIKATNLVNLNETYIKKYPYLRNSKLTPKLVVTLVMDKVNRCK